MRDGHAECSGCRVRARKKNGGCGYCLKPVEPGHTYCAHHREYHRLLARRLRYGISKEQYDTRLAAQHGQCAICGATEHILGTLGVDHDHRSGRIRGLLCSFCNLAIGNMRDNPALLRKAATYLEKIE